MSVVFAFSTELTIVLIELCKKCITPPLRNNSEILPFIGLINNTGVVSKITNVASKHPKIIQNTNK